MELATNGLSKCLRHALMSKIKDELVRAPGIPSDNYFPLGMASEVARHPSGVLSIAMKH
jgi:hypothetical protein